MVRIEGELVGPAGEPLLAAVRTALADPALPPGPLVLEFSGVPTMDSSAFSAWVRAERLAEAAGRRLRVTGARPLVRELFELADLADALLPG